MLFCRSPIKRGFSLRDFQEKSKSERLTGIDDIRVSNEAYTRLQIAECATLYFASMGILFGIVAYETNYYSGPSYQDTRVNILLSICTLCTIALGK